MSTHSIILIILFIIFIVCAIIDFYYILLLDALRYTPKHFKRLKNLILIKRFPFLKVEYYKEKHIKKYKTNKYSRLYKRLIRKFKIDKLDKSITTTLKERTILTTTYLDSFYGLRYPLGFNFCFELDNLIKKFGLKPKDDEYPGIPEIKEKFGELRITINTSYDEIEELESKYELLSIGYCFGCGRPARYLNKGWIYYLCEDCFRKQNNCSNTDDISSSRLTENDMPVIYNHVSLQSGKTDKIKVDYKLKYGVDLYKLWDLKPTKQNLMKEEN